MSKEPDRIAPGSPCVAVVIAAYNAETTLARAIVSALAQPETLEVIVIDDGSMDGTRELAATFAERDRRVRMLAQANAGPSAARNRCVGELRAPVWCVLDADDEFEPGRLGAILRAVGDDWDMAADGVRFLMADGGVHVMGAAPPLPREIDFVEFVLGNVPRRNAPRRELGYLQPLMRTAFFRDRGLSFNPSLRFAEDYVLFAQALAAGARFRCAPGAGYVAHVIGGSLSHSQSWEDYEAVIRADRAMLAQIVGKNERRALARHIHSQRLKAAHLRADDALRQGRPISALAEMLRSPHTAAFAANHRLRPRASRWIKQFMGLAPEHRLLSRRSGVR